MKTLLASLAAIAVLATLSACTTVVEKPMPTTHTTTTEETTIQRPMSTTTETRVRSYNQ